MLMVLYFKEPPRSFPQKDSMSSASSSSGSFSSSMASGGAPAPAPASSGNGYTSSSHESYATTHHPSLSTPTMMTKEAAAAAAEKEAADLVEYPQTSSTVRGVEIGIVLLVLFVWVAAIALFFNRWGKIRMLLPYQPDYKQEQLKVPGTAACAAAIASSATCTHATTEHVCQQVLIQLLEDFRGPSKSRR